MKKIKLGILKGGTSNEREVSLMTYEKIINNIDKNKYNILEIEVPEFENNDWIKKLIDEKPDVVLIALHGGKGENGAVQGLLECLNIPYVGSKVLGSSIGMNKNLSKKIMRYNYISVPEDFFIALKDDYKKNIESIEKIGYPLVVKPNCGGSGIGISIVRDRKSLINAIEIVKKLKDDILIEKFISGKEVTCGIVEKDGVMEVMSVLDIDTYDGFYDYNARYKDNRSKIDFSVLPEFLQTMIQEMAKKVFKCLECSGYARVDMIVSEEQVYVIEINTLPGMTSRSLIPKALENKENAFSAFLDTIINNEIKSF